MKKKQKENKDDLEMIEVIDQENQMIIKFNPELNIQSYVGLTAVEIDLF